jgi:O-antigen ligase
LAGSLRASVADSSETHSFNLFNRQAKILARIVTAKIALTPETLKSAYSTVVTTAAAMEHAAPRLPQSSNPIGNAAFVLFGVYVLSGFANDWSLHVFGVKAYLSTATLFLLPLAWLFSGQALRGLRSTAGLFWAAFLLWMLLATPFSVWRGGSARAYLEFFYTCSFVTSLRRCRQWMYVQIGSGAALLLSCVAFGNSGGNLGNDSGEARFMIPGSLFYANSNDLALALLLAIACFLFLFHRQNRAERLAGIAGILLSASYAFRTGSRGCVIAASAMLILIFWMSRNRWSVAALGLLALLVALLVPGTHGESSSTLHRLSLLTSADASPAEKVSDLASVASQQEREDLFKTSLRYTMSHPLFGVGPDQFAAAVSQDAARFSQPAPWLGTHNTYTQVSSECGVPALIFYVAVIGLCLRSNLRLYRRTRDRPADSDLAGLSRCLIAGTLVFAVSAFFFHMAYSAYLPTLAGFTVALQFAAGNSDHAAGLEVG